MKKYLLLIVLGAFVLNSCEFLLPCLEGNGDIETEQRIGGTFNSIEVEGEFNVVVEYAPVTSVEVTSNENLLEYIETTVRNNKLTIGTTHKGCINFDEQTEVLIRCPQVNSISQYGSGNIEVYDFSEQYLSVTAGSSGHITLSNISVSEDLDIFLIGSGNVWIKGRAQKGYFNHSGSGNIDAEAMRVFESVVTLSGSGNVHTYSYEVLKVTLTGSGDVYYYGNPTDVVTKNTGSGRVINRSY